MNTCPRCGSATTTRGGQTIWSDAKWEECNECGWKSKPRAVYVVPEDPQEANVCEGCE